MFSVSYVEVTRLLTRFLLPESLFGTSPKHKYEFRLIVQHSYLMQKGVLRVIKKQHRRNRTAIHGVIKQR